MVDPSDLESGVARRVGSSPTMSTKINKMKINIDYISTKHYNWSNIGWWVWYYKPYTYVKGFNIRLFGLHLNIREKNTSEKLLAVQKL